MNPAGKRFPRRNIPRWIAFSPALTSIFLLAVSGGSPVLDQHGFRQAQTLMSAYWMGHGGPWVLFRTPIFDLACPSATAGFEADLPLADLPPGRYAISILDQGKVPAGECLTGKLPPLPGTGRLYFDEQRGWKRC